MTIYIMLFLNIFVVYLYTLFPTIAAYRDSGEMASVGYLLGIAHPPGYPLYTLCIYLFGKIVPFGNFAYRINLFSSIVSTLSSVLLFYLYNFFIEKFGIKKNLVILLIGYLLSLIFSFGYLQWYLSIVSEMYTFNILFAVLLVIFCSKYFFSFSTKVIYGLFFVFGLALANRIDLVLFVPILIFVFLDYIKQHKSSKNILILTFLFTIGISCYIYMPLRSIKNPFIDWNNPETFVRLYSSLLRKTHGSTLDLISAGYQAGENFVDGIKFYFQHLLNNLSILGLIIILFGTYRSFKLNYHFGLSLLLSWFLSCVYFIYKANMPPNPHSFAILEAHFLLPNVIIYVWLLLGVAETIKKYKNVHYVIFILLIILVGNNFFVNVKKLNKRNNFYAYDYTINILRSVPDNSIIVVKEDVQVFSLWYRKFVEKIRPKVYIIAAGLSGSEWYKQMCYNYFLYNNLPQIFITSVQLSETLKEFVEKNVSLGYNIFFTPDVEIPKLQNSNLINFGLVSSFSKENKAKEVMFLINNIYVFRGKYLYDLSWEFFSSDIIEDYSKAFSRAGYELMKEDKNFELSTNLYKVAIYMIPFLPFNYFELGYLYFIKNNLDNAYLYYKIGCEKFIEYLSLAEKYKASSDIVENIKMQTANCFLHLGVVYEKHGKIEQAIESYNKALSYNPYLPEAYYNLGVVYWHLKNWPKVVHYFKETLRLNPNHKEAKFYLEKILSQ